MKDVVQTSFGASSRSPAKEDLPLKVEISDGLPHGRGDERRITQVLLNLVGNAIKFTDTGEVAIKASSTNGIVHGRRSSIRARVSPEPIRRRFSKSSSRPTARTPRRRAAPGLGLAIAKRIVEMHGGRIWVESELGQGIDIFIYELPVKVEQQVRRGMTKRILIVEDQEDNRQILRDLLTFGIRFDRGERRRRGVGRDRQAAARSHPDGHPAAGYRRLRGDTPDQGDPSLKSIPIIVVTSYALSGDEGKARAAGCDAYVTKPFSPRRLLAKVREFLP